MNAVEMEYCQLTRLDRVRNEDFRQQMNAGESTLSYPENIFSDMGLLKGWMNPDG